MESEKPFRSLEQQLSKLIERGLNIPDEEVAKQQLLKTSYYDLINGYKDFFLESKNNNNDEDQYKEGTKFRCLST